MSDPQQRLVTTIRWLPKPFDVLFATLTLFVMLVIFLVIVPALHLVEWCQEVRSS